MLEAMTMSGPESPPVWRVAVTRAEGSEGRLRTALLERGFDPVSCVVMKEGAPTDPNALVDAAVNLARYRWVVCASARAVRALRRARGAEWPKGLRTAAVGPRTAEALLEAGADPAPVVAGNEGADELWRVLRERDDWTGRRVLVPTVRGGLRILAVRLREAGAHVDEVEAYRMTPRSEDLVRADWAAARPDAVVIASPSAAAALAKAVGAAALAGARAVVAIGPTTSSALTALGIAHTISPRTDAGEVARHLTAIRAASLAP